MKYFIRAFSTGAVCLVLLCSTANSQTSACGPADQQCKINENTKRIAANGGDIEAFYNRGLAYAVLGRHDEAISDFSKYIAGKPSNKEYLADGYNERANNYKNKGNYKSAIADYNTALSLFTSSIYLNNRGNCYMSMGDNESALTDFNRAIATNAKEPEPYYNRAKVYSSQKLYNKAIADLNVYVGLNTTNIPFLADGYQNRGLAYFNLNNFDQALKDATKAIELDPTAAARFTVRASIYRKLGKESLAKADESAAADLKP